MSRAAATEPLLGGVVMGWSCAESVDKVLRRLKAANAYIGFKCEGREYFLEIVNERENLEYPDGRVKVEAVELLPDGRCRVADEFYIVPTRDGRNAYATQRGHRYLAALGFDPTNLLGGKK